MKSIQGWDGGTNTKSARELRNNLTDAERRLWRKLKRRQIATVKFRAILDAVEQRI